MYIPELSKYIIYKWRKVRTGPSRNILRISKHALHFLEVKLPLGRLLVRITLEISGIFLKQTNIYHIYLFHQVIFHFEDAIWSSFRGPSGFHSRSGGGGAIRRTIQTMARSNREKHAYYASPYLGWFQLDASSCAWLVLVVVLVRR